MCVAWQAICKDILNAGTGFKIPAFRLHGIISLACELSSAIKNFNL